MKSTREIVKTNPSLLDYYEKLQDEIVAFQFQKTNNKEIAMRYFRAL